MHSVTHPFTMHSVTHPFTMHSITHPVTMPYIPSSPMYCVLKSPHAFCHRTALISVTQVQQRSLG
jgi:hypothetical protein